MRSGGRRTLALAAILLIALSSFAAAERTRRGKKQEQQPATAPATPADKRDRTVNVAGNPFNGRAYWQAAAQCGGVYFKLGSLNSEAAIRAKVIRPDPAAYASLTKDADDASRRATAFFVVAERVLISDRKLSRDEAVIIYDPLAGASGDRVKTLEAAAQAAKPCPELYQACRAAYPQVCNDTSMLTN
ncbi:MAG: hypothetical protein E6G97_06995 [Alphaproteobacteria bacterium]|nr:MAG: hypothetical protein E6G97_06995 [Alphaproteobacteria bacterium]